MICALLRGKGCQRIFSKTSADATDEGATVPYKNCRRERVSNLGASIAMSGLRAVSLEEFAKLDRAPEIEMDAL